MSEYILKLEHISKSFEGVEVLKDISLDVKKGEFITFLGPSGCGKTTTLKIVSGLLDPDEGRVVLHGQDVTELPPEKRNVNTVFQSYALFPHMTVEGNVGYGLKLKKVPKAEIAKRVKEMLELVQLAGYEKRYPEELSGGQQQRVAIARALANGPEVLLLDEPLGALDLQLRRQMQLELKRLQKKLGITFIYITHDQEEAINMSDRIVVMDKGIFQQVGTPDEVYNRPKNEFVARFVGNANIIPGEGGESLAIRTENILLDVPGGIEAVVKDKSFAGGLMRIELETAGGTTVVATRHGIDYAAEVGQTMTIGWEPKNAVVVEKE
ncbi:MAG: ABC transporter ATP-binding protein [Firmicutes bacterium]|nr:ABC transporter ATP-binding protein [Bacillota bacterium]